MTDAKNKVTIVMKTSEEENVSLMAGWFVRDWDCGEGVSFMWHSARGGVESSYRSSLSAIDRFPSLEVVEAEKIPPGHGVELDNVVVGVLGAGHGDLR